MRFKTSIVTLLFLFTWSAGITDGFYFVLPERPHEIFDLVYRLAQAWAACIWIKVDAPSRKIAIPFDFGFLYCVIWPFAGIWYLYRSRGFKGLLWLLPIIGSYGISFWLGHVMIPLIR